MTFFDLKPQDSITLIFPIYEKTFCYTANARSPQEQVYTCTFRGSTLMDISPRDQREAIYPLYQRQALRQPVAPLRQVERYVADHIVKLW